MSQHVPADMDSFVAEMLLKRRFFSEEEVVREGLRLLQSRETLREEVRKGFDQLDQGAKVSASELARRGKQTIAKHQQGTESCQSRSSRKKLRLM